MKWNIAYRELISFDKNSIDFFEGTPKPPTTMRPVYTVKHEPDVNKINIGKESQTRYDGEYRRL